MTSTPPRSAASSSARNPGDRRGSAASSDPRRRTRGRGTDTPTADRAPRTDDRGARSTDRTARSADRGGRTDNRNGRTDGRSGRTDDRGGRSEQRGGRPAAAATGASALFAAQRIPTEVDPRSFAELGVPTSLLPALAGLGATAPFPIQSATLDATLAGRDVLGRGKTGSGKTIAFAIPLITRLTGGRREPNRPRGLVLAPTRELALQIERTLVPLAAAAGLRTAVIFGGVGYGPQLAALRRGVDILIACPGRLEDLQQRNAVDLSSVAVTVLDEADHMADLGFLPGVRRILRSTDPRGQRMLFSATLDNGISVLVKDFLVDPAVFAVDDETSPIEALTHHVFAVTADQRAEVVRQLAGGGERRLLFTRTKHSARKWAAQLSKSGINAVDLHGNLSQNARERNLAAFADGSAQVMVATDIAARGIHVDGIELVVHVDPPTEHKAYLHRSGRTARAGAAGTVVTLMLPEQRSDVTQLMRRAGISPTHSTVVPGSPIIASLDN